MSYHATLANGVAIHAPSPAGLALTLAAIDACSTREGHARVMAEERVAVIGSLPDYTGHRLDAEPVDTFVGNLAKTKEAVRAAAERDVEGMKWTRADGSPARSGDALVNQGDAIVAVPAKFGGYRQVLDSELAESGTLVGMGELGETVSE